MLNNNHQLNPNINNDQEKAYSFHLNARFKHVNEGSPFNLDKLKKDDNFDDDRLEKNRERNREHAKKTRLRKKAMLDGLKDRLIELQSEAVILQQKLEECDTVNILLCLGDQKAQASSKDNINLNHGLGTDLNISLNKGNIIGQLRRIVREESALTLRANADLYALSNQSGSKSVQSDEKSDENASDDDDDGGSHSDGANTEVVDVRRERNRIHAKLTRDRKKIFTSKLRQLIQTLERQNAEMRSKLLSKEKENPKQESHKDVLRPRVEPSNPFTMPPTALLMYQQYLMQSQHNQYQSMTGGYYPMMPGLISSRMEGHPYFPMPMFNMPGFNPSLQSMKRKAHEAFEELPASHFQQMFPQYSL